MQDPLYADFSKLHTTSAAQVRVTKLMLQLNMKLSDQCVLVLVEYDWPDLLVRLLDQHYHDNSNEWP